MAAKDGECYIVPRRVCVGGGELAVRHRDHARRVFSIW